MMIRRITAALAACAAISAVAAPLANTTQYLAQQQTVTGAGTIYQTTISMPSRSYSATVTCTDACAAGIDVEVSHDGVNFAWRGRFTLSGTTSASDVFSDINNWRFVRSNVTSISGTGAAVDVIMSSGTN